MATRDQEQTEIIHINISGITNKRTELIHYLNEHNPQFVTKKESKIRKQHAIRIPNYHVKRKDRDNPGYGGGGGVAILIRNKLDTSEFDEEFLAILFESDKRKIALATIYNLPETSPSVENFKFILNKYPDSIFMGDYNSKHEFFGCKKYNKEGDILFNILEELSLIVTNDGTPTHYTNTSSNILDQCIVSRSIVTKVDTCTVGLDVGSDHMPVHLVVNSSKIVRQNQRETLHHEKTDWVKPRKIINKNLTLTDAITPAEIDETFNNIANKMKTALDKSCPKSKVKDMDFFRSEETSKLIKLKRKIRWIAQITYKAEHKNLANRLKILTSKAVQNDKATWWQTKTQEMDPAKNSKSLWKNFHKIIGKISQAETNNPVIKNDGTPTENDIEKANTFAETLGGIHNTHKGLIFDDTFKKEVDDKIAENYHLFNPLELYVDEKGDENPIIRHISIIEIKKQLSKTKGRSAPGQDCIRYTALKQCPEIVFKNLEQIYNICLQTGYFLEPWKQAIGTMIPKPNKKHKITTNYRPISLLSCIGKLFEKILANRIRGKLDKRKFFNQWQLGYRNKKCAMEHILRLTDDALTGLQANRLGVAVFIDVEKAFDLVWHNGLRYKLMNSELPNKIIRLMSLFISDRTIAVKINDEMSDKVKFNTGIPQGSVLSPLLFLMYVNDIPVDPMNNQVKISQFADDLGMWTFGPNSTYVQNRIHRTL